MKQLIGAVYLSFGVLFLILSGFGDFYQPVYFNIILILFFIVGIGYIISSFLEKFK